MAFLQTCFPALGPLRPLDSAAVADCRRRWDGVAKPLGSLGKLEDLLAQLAGLGGSASLTALRKCVLVFCADNGVVAQGVSQSGSEVTAAVARSIAEGTANVNAMAAVAGAEVTAVDVGMLHPLDCPGLLDRRVAAGTGDIALGPAMTRAQALKAIGAGIGLADEKKAQGYGLLATGEMGIGNTTTSAALACALLGRSPEQMTGRGAGLSDAGLTRKLHVIRQALALHQPDPADPLDALCRLGGFDIAAMAGVFLGGAARRIPVVIDGFISAVAALVAARLEPLSTVCMLPSHLSREPAMGYVLDALGLCPILHADMALGEGTGAVALFPLLDMALAVYRSSHTFDSIQVPAYEHWEGKA